MGQRSLGERFLRARNPQVGKHITAAYDIVVFGAHFISPGKKCSAAGMVLHEFIEQQARQA